MECGLAGKNQSFTAVRQLLAYIPFRCFMGPATLLEIAAETRATSDHYLPTIYQPFTRFLMNFSALLKQPLTWVAALGVLLVLVLAFWYIKRPTDADGNSLILTAKEEKAVRRDMSQQAARRTLDSSRAAHADSAATTLYSQGQQNAATARRLNQTTHEKALSSDTTAHQLQRELSDY